jgi:hypothetical protein
MAAPKHSQIFSKKRIIPLQLKVGPFGWLCVSPKVGPHRMRTLYHRGLPVPPVYPGGCREVLPVFHYTHSPAHLRLAEPGLTKSLLIALSSKGTSNLLTISISELFSAGLLCYTDLTFTQHSWFPPIRTDPYTYPALFQAYRD